MMAVVAVVSNDNVKRLDKRVREGPLYNNGLPLDAQLCTRLILPYDLGLPFRLLISATSGKNSSARPRHWPLDTSPQRHVDAR
jgi:hypothetical protein